MRSVSGTARGFESPARTQILTLAASPRDRQNNWQVKKILIIGTIFFVGLVATFYTFVIRDHNKLYETVKTDFADKYPNYEFIECGIGEGDLVAADVHVRFKRPGDDKIQEEVWQYWDTDSVWLHRDKYLELTKDKGD